MLTVTANAKEQLKQILQQQTDPQMAIRIIPSPSKPGQLQFGLDKPRKEDQVVETEEGKKLLLIGPDLVPTLDRIVMDYQETPQGSGFTMSELAQEAKISKAPERKAGKIVQITDQNFEEEVLRSDLPTEVDFWAPWCGPCQMVIPIYEKLSEEYEGRFKFCMINVDENQRTATKYQIMSIPMQKYFANGEAVDEILGAVPEQTIRSKVEDILNRFPADEMGGLKVLLTSWVEYNKEHEDKFSKWAQQAKNMEGDPVYSRALQAAEEVEKANEHLSQILMQLTNDKVGMMAKSTSEPEIRQALAGVNHPEIARTLVDLGMLKDIMVKGKKVSLTLALPLMGIPTQVKDYLTNSVRQALANLDASLEIDINLAEMNPQERAKFFAMEQEGWTG